MKRILIIAGAAILLSVALTVCNRSTVGNDKISPKQPNEDEIKDQAQNGETGGENEKKRTARGHL